MPEQQFHFGSFLKLLAIALVFGVIALFLNIQFGISFQAIQIVTVALLAIVAAANFFKIRALRSRSMTADQREIRELQAMQERQLDAMLTNERNNIDPKS